MSSRRLYRAPPKRHVLPPYPTYDERITFALATGRWKEAFPNGPIAGPDSYSPGEKMLLSLLKTDTDFLGTSGPSKGTAKP